MEKNVGNADRHDQKITNEEVGFAASKHDDDVIDEDKEEYYKGKIEALVNEKYNSFIRKQNFTQLQEFITSDEINGSDINLVIQKTVCARLITQNWLNMPFKKVETRDFLTPEEKQVLGDGSEIEVALVGPELQMYKKPMSLKIGGKWKNKNYVLKTNWSDFVEANKNVLEEGTAIQVWSFRKGEQLCFAVLCVPKLVLGF